ncbi:MAG: hypothetical protein ACRELB_13760, partial [Polyangiaceae bacterium]
CNGTNGIAAPICSCTASAPCSCETIPFCNRFCPDGGTMTSSLDVPLCKTSSTCGGKHLVFDDGPAAVWTDATGGAQQRAYCLYSPPTASAASQRPLVVFLHGSGGSADDVYDATSLRAKAPTFDLVGGGTRTGFFLASDQGRNVANPNGDLGAAPRHDIYFRDLASPSKNPDVRAIDHLIDSIASGGAVDPARIYLVGWSNGAFFAALYALARYSTPTPGGFEVAGATVFAGGDPFDDARDGDDGACSYRPYPQAPAAIYVIHRGCDSAVACDASQNQQFSNPPGYDVADWVTTLTGSVGATVQDVILSSAGAQVAQCDDNFSLCTSAVGLLNHISWPDGLATEDAKAKNDWEGAAVGGTPGMLGFLGAHPHP